MRASMLLETDPAAAARGASAVLLNHPAHDAASLLLSAACRRLGNSSSAVGIIEALADVQPESAIVHLELGRTYAACARTRDAKAALERAVELDANLADAWRELSEQRLLEGETAAADQAYAHYRRLGTTPPELAEAYAAYAHYRRLATNPPELAEAYAAFDQNRLEASELQVQRCLRAGTNDVAAFTLLAAIALRRGDDLAEETHLNRILAQAACDSNAREQLVRLLIRQGRTEQALLLIERLLAVEPGRSAYLLLKLLALQSADRHAESLAIITQLLAEHPDDADIWLIAGNQQRYMNQSRQAVDSYLRAIAIRPGIGMAYW